MKERRMIGMTEMIRVVPAVIGAAGMILFLVPAVAAGIVNIGNVTGFIVSAAFLFWGVFHRRIQDFLRAAWSRGGFPGRAALVFAAAAAACIAVTALVLTFMMIAYARRRPAADADVIVLGCEVKRDRPSRMLKRRMDAAIEWLEEHPDVKCVLSGGKGETELISEAECMYRYMTARGIDPERLLKEERSVSTRENLLFSMELLEQEGRTPSEIAIVTNEFHEARACLIAKKLGLGAGSVPAPSTPWLLPTFYVRELYGLLYQFFF